MKKFHIIIICLFYARHVNGQQEVMKLTLPKGTEKLVEQQLKSLSHRGFNEKNVSDFHDHVYKKDGLLIYYLNLSTSPKLKKSLESYQRMMVSLLGQLKSTVVDSSKIITVNNVRFLIIESHEKDNMTIQFTSDYDKNCGFINGFIEYKKPDEVEAGQYLKELLRSMHFKNN